MSDGAARPELAPALRLLGPSGCGKTTLGERLVAALGARGYRVATVKSARKHPAPADRAGSDTDRYGAAGAVASVGVFADAVEWRMPPDAPLDALRAALAPVADLVLVEGFQDAALPALVFHGADAKGAIPAELVVARIAAGERPPSPNDAPRFDRDDLEAIAGAVERWLLASR